MLDFDCCCPRRKEGIVLRKLGGEAILYDPGQKKAHVLNATALTIWELCSGEVSVRQIEERLKGDFEIDDPLELRSDIEETLVRFHTEGILVL
ncbi:MAG: hypothetical protein C4326_05805 [Ignavibacteria bacterium]